MNTLLLLILLNEPLPPPITIAYCKNMAGDIVTIAAGSPCPQGYYPL